MLKFQALKLPYQMKDYRLQEIWCCTSIGYVEDRIDLKVYIDY